MKILKIIFLLFPINCFGLSIPSYQQTSPGGDEVRSRDGTSCRQGNHPTPVLDVGGMAGNDPINSSSLANGFGSTPSMNNGDTAPMGGSVYGRIVIPLDISNVPRVDCTRLYDLEVERLELEIEQLKKGAAGAVQVE